MTYCRIFVSKRMRGHPCVEQLLPPFPTVCFDDVSYSSGLVDRVTRAVRDHSCGGPILGFLTERKVRPKKVRPKIVRPKYSDRWIQLAYPTILT